MKGSETKKILEELARTNKENRSKGENILYDSYRDRTTVSDMIERSGGKEVLDEFLDVIIREYGHESNPAIIVAAMIECCDKNLNEEACVISIITTALSYLKNYDNGIDVWSDAASCCEDYADEEPDDEDEQEDCCEGCGHCSEGCEGCGHCSESCEGCGHCSEGCEGCGHCCEGCGHCCEGCGHCCEGCGHCSESCEGCGHCSESCGHCSEGCGHCSESCSNINITMNDYLSLSQQAGHDTIAYITKTGEIYGCATDEEIKEIKIITTSGKEVSLF